MINVDRVERVKRKALEYDFLSGCSQSVLGAIQEEFAIGNIDSFKAATVLSGGVVRKGETCGAIIGALLSLGLVIGRERMEDFDAYQGAMKVGLEGARPCRKKGTFARTFAPKTIIRIIRTYYLVQYLGRS